MEIQETIIKTDVYKTWQTAHFKQILKMNDKKLRIKIESDSYDFQSLARIYLFDGKDWKCIYSIPYTDMSTPHELAFAPNWSTDNVSVFEKDINDLKEMARQLLF